jgi:plastocyanin
MRRHQALTVGMATALLVLGLTTIAQARDGGRGGGGGAELIRVQDDCDPATFNTDPTLPPNACDPRFDGDTSPAELFAEVAEERDAGKWRFHPDETHISRGESLHVVNQGGEFHTFTPVEAFGDGCIPDKRLSVGEDQVAECARFDELAQTTGLPFRGKLTVTPGDVAEQLYQCLIHPWMRTTVEVRSGGHHH